MSGREIYDVSAKDRRIAEYRAAKRTRLRAEYLQQAGNPYKMALGESGTVFDLGLQRFQSMRETVTETFRPNPRNALFGLFGMILPTALVMYFIIGHKDQTEVEYRTGQVSYRDREFKFQ